MPFRPSSRRAGRLAFTAPPPADQGFAALWERHREDLHRTAMAIVQDGECAGEALEQARADALSALRTNPSSLTRARLHRFVRDAATDRIDLFAATGSPAEVDARAALVLHGLGLDVEQIAEALALTPAAAHALLSPVAPAPEPVTVMVEAEPEAEVEPEPAREPEPVAAPPRERRRRPVWQPLAGGGVAVAAAVGALALLVPGQSPAPVANGATSLGIGPALPPPAADGSGRPDTASFGLLASSRETRGRAGAEASPGAAVADASVGRGSSGDPSFADGLRGGGERTGGSAPADGGRRVTGAPRGNGPSGGGQAPRSGGGAPAGDGPSGGGGAPSGGDGPSGGGGAPSDGGSPRPTPVAGPAPSPTQAPAPAPSAPAPTPRPGPIQQLVDTTVNTVERIAGPVLAGD